MPTEKEIEQTLRNYYNAFQNKDWSAFESALDDGFTYYTDGCIVQHKPAFVEFLINDGWQGTGYNLSDLSIITANDLSIANYKVAFEGLENGKKITVFALETTVLRGLKLLHTHSSNTVEKEA